MVASAKQFPRASCALSVESFRAALGHPVLLAAMAGLLGAALLVVQPVSAQRQRDNSGIPEAVRPIAMLAIGKAVEAAAELTSPDDGTALARSIANAQAEIGDLAGALRTARQMQPGRHRDRALKTIAEAQILQGDFEDAIATADLAHTGGMRSEIWRDVIEALSESGQVKHALNLATNLNSAFQVQALAKIGAAARKNGDHSSFAAMMSDAATLAGALREPPERAEAEIAIAEGWLAAGNVDGARAALSKADEAAGEAGDAEIQAELLAAISALQVSIDGPEAALLTVGRITERGSEKQARRQLTTWLVDNGEFESALRIARAMPSPEPRAEVLAMIGQSLMKSGREAWANAVFEEAIGLAKGVADRSDRSESVAAIAKHQAVSTAFVGSRATIQLIEDQEQRAAALAELAKAIADKSDDIGQARAVVAELLSLAEEITDPEKRSAALLSATEATARTGLFSQALQIAGSLLDPADRAAAFVAIAEGAGRVKRENVEAVADLPGRVPDGQRR